MIVNAGPTGISDGQCSLVHDQGHRAQSGDLIELQQADPLRQVQVELQDHQSAVLERQHQQQQSLNGVT